MNKLISVIIPTYKEPEALDLCLRSCIEGQVNKNEIIVVVDGFYDINKEVLDKYKNHISVLNLEQNVGMIRAMNLGTYNASNELVFHCQDDNVFPCDWDKKLLQRYGKGMVLVPNQIEPIPSMFKQFHIENLGRDPKTFDLEHFWKVAKRQNELPRPICDDSGSTFPFLISKTDYLRIGGLDETYPSPWTVDVEFFLKCKLSGLKMQRYYGCHFYHFVSLGHSTSTPEKLLEKQRKEIESAEYFKYKWGGYAKRDENINITY